MNKFIRDFLYTLLCNSFLSMKNLPKFDKRTKPIRNTARLKFGIGKKYLLDFFGSTGLCWTPGTQST